MARLTWAQRVSDARLTADNAMSRWLANRPGESLLTRDGPRSIYVNVLNIHMLRRGSEEDTTMAEVVAKIDDFGKPAWIALMVVGFVLFWPLGLGILIYLLWSGRMSCGWNRGAVDTWREGATQRWENRREHWERKMQGWGRQGGLRPTGNRAFDEYRVEALQRLEEEANEFRAFLERLRMAKDRQEFDEYMRQRRDRPSGSTPEPEPKPQG